MKYTSIILLFTSLNVLAHQPLSDNYSSKAILADITLLKSANIPIFSQDLETGVGYALITPEMESRISQKAHEVGKCGGFESLGENRVLSVDEADKIFANLRDLNKKEEARQKLPLRPLELSYDSDIEAAISQVKPENLQNTVEWLSSFNTRYHKSAEKNRHVFELKARLEEMAQNYPGRVQLDLIDHNSTGQKSLRLRLLGKNQNELVVLGGHLDSIVSWGWGSENRSPGSDDNASGSANLVEAYRILLNQPMMERTVEFMWYAGEEAGLLGSAEIAKSYKQANLNVVGVLQLDMTLFPGSGPMVISSMTDFTSSWMRDILSELNRLYLKVEIVEDKCGYACSDHASWYRQGYPTLMPFESSFNTMNNNIHTNKDLIDNSSDFSHSAIFSKLAVSLAMTLANSDMHD